MRLSGPEALDFFQSVQKANYHSHRPKLLMRPQRPWGRGCSYRSVGGGVLVPVCWGKGSDAPPVSTDAPPASFGGRGPQVVGKESYKRGVSSILFLSCSAIFCHPDNSSGACVCIVNLCDISLVKHSEFL